MNEVMIVIFRTVLVLIILFVLAKKMGKKQVSEMNIFDYSIGITIGSIAADISLDIDKNLVAGVVCLVIYGLVSVLVSYLTMKSLGLRKFFCGDATVLIEKGHIIEKNLLSEGIDINDLQEEARQNNFFDLSKINYAILETSGKISFLPFGKYDYVTRDDMKIKALDEGLLCNAIIDTKLIVDNIKSIGKSREWLDKKLMKLGYRDYSNILLATIDCNDNVKVYEKDVCGGNS